MLKSNPLALITLAFVFAAGCRSHSSVEQQSPQVERKPSAEEARLAELKAKPLYQFAPADVDVYLRGLQKSEPDFRKRVVHLARKNIGQPYELYLLGEQPFESIDPQPVYCLDRSDCVVFAEHTLAMALTDSWPEFLAMLQRIRYRDGEIGVATRNHYTEADWNRNNTWLAQDVTREIGGASVIPFTQKVDRAKFLQGRYKLDRSDIPVETIEESFIPYEAIAEAKPHLRDGDVVNFVTGQGNGYWVGHVGLVAIAPDGGVNLIHSAKPQVREEPIEAYVERNTKDRAAREAAGKSVFRGFKFLRLTDDPWVALRAIDGADAPKVTVPKDSGMTFEQFVASFEARHESAPAE